MYLFDQHVEVLGNLGCEAYHVEVTPSVLKTKQRQCDGWFAFHHADAETCSHLVLRRVIRAVLIIPLDLRIRRILFPDPGLASNASKSVYRQHIPVTTLT